MGLLLDSSLERMNADDLRKIAKNLGAFEKTHTRKADFIGAIADYMHSQPAKFIGALSEPERCLLAEMAHNDIVPTASQFQARFSMPYPLTYSYSYGRGALPPSVLRCFVPGNGSRIPESRPLLDKLKPLLPAPAAPNAKTLPAPPERYRGRTVQVFSGELRIAMELGRVLRFIHAGKAKVTEKTRRPTDATTRLISSALAEPDFDLEDPTRKEKDKYYNPAGPVRAHAWGVLVQQCGWAKASAGRLALTAGGREMVKEFTPERFKKGVTRFLLDNGFDELHRVNQIRGQTGKAKSLMSKPGDRRSTFAENLEVLPTGEWVDFDEAFRVLESVGGNLPVLPADHGVLYICDAHYGTIFDGPSISRQYLRALTMESLATLGLFDIACVYPHQLWPEFSDSYGCDSHSFLGRYDGLLAVRLNALGAYCLDVCDTYDFTPPEVEKRLQLLPNHDIAIVGDTDAADVAFLELIARPVGERVWKLDAATILQSMENGTRLSDVREFLSAAAQNGIPANIVTWLDDLGERTQACRTAQRAVLLEWRDPVEANLVATGTGTGKLCHYAGENRIVVPERNLTAFTREARKLGFLVPPAG